MSKIVVVMALLASAFGPTTVWAAQSGKDKPAPPTIPYQEVSLDPLPSVSGKIGGLKIYVTQVYYAGLPDRAACRFVVRAINRTNGHLAAYTLLKTFDGDKAALNTWMVPTGDLAPGETSEKQYSCKTAQYLEVDRQSASGWPGRCELNGKEVTPCPLSVGVEANLHVLTSEN